MGEADFDTIMSIAAERSDIGIELSEILCPSIVVIQLRRTLLIAGSRLEPLVPSYRRKNIVAGLTTQVWQKAKGLGNPQRSS